MSRDVTVNDLPPNDFVAFRELAKEHPHERAAARAVFQAGLRALAGQPRGERDGAVAPAAGGIGFAPKDREPKPAVPATRAEAKAATAAAAVDATTDATPVTPEGVAAPTTKAAAKKAPAKRAKKPRA